MTKGRPTKLTPELIELAQNYVNEGDTNDPTSLLPTIERLCILLGVHRDTLYAWEKENADISDILTHLRFVQGDKLIQNSLIGRYNANISKMMLSKHGYVEQTATDITTNGESINQYDQLSTKELRKLASGDNPS